MADKYSYCPDCGHKTVYLRMRPNGEDNYGCRLKDCSFYFYTLGDSVVDRENEARWKAAQLKKGIPND